MRTLVLLMFIIPSVALALGATGHRAVCQIAYEELNDTARTEVDRLIKLDAGFETFADSCLFADGPPRIRMFDHFINVPRSYTAITKNECPMADTCLFKAIDSDASILSSEDSSDIEKLLALKLLGHWVGDMHQPLHVSYQDDLGGNLIPKKDDPRGGNIHSVWDFDIIEQRVGTDYLQIATDLRSAITDRERAMWKFDSPVEWANESYQITISPSVEYCVQQRGACWYSADNMMIDKGELKKMLVASDQYLTDHQKIMVRRMKQAGIRLAALLNSAIEQSD